MRVLQAIAGARHGGAETFFVSLVLALHAAGLDQRVVMRRNAERGARLRAAGIEPVELRFGGRFDLRTPRRLAREAADYRADVVVTWMSRASYLFPRGDYVLVGRLGGYYGLKYFRKCDHLLGITPDGKHDWNHCEQVQLISVINSHLTKDDIQNVFSFQSLFSKTFIVKTFRAFAKFRKRKKCLHLILFQPLR